MYFATHRDNLGGTEAMGFLERLLGALSGKGLVLWDNGTIHKAPEVRTFAWLNRPRLDLWRFPPYTPEPDPQEGVWEALKKGLMGNYCAPDTLEQTVNKNAGWLQRPAEVVLAAMHPTKLPLPDPSGPG